MSHQSARIIDGKSIAAALKLGIAAQVKTLPRAPGLAVILVGDDPASAVYVGSKIKACATAGIKSFETRLPASASQQDVIAAIQSYNNNKDVHGILLQLPVPKHLDTQALIESIDPSKDVDGLTTQNMGRLMAGMECLIPCTPQGTLILIQSVFSASSPPLMHTASAPPLAGGKGGDISPLSGLHAVIIGRSLLFGKPMGQLLLAQDCTVTQAHSKTRDLPALCRQADILIAAVGKANMVKGDWIKPGAIVMDVGINRLPDGTLTGDVNFIAAAKIASAITPVPGGVGPMTIACLLANTVKAANI
jgi:methylenetetrahydrofolate dehydrogenase (NADP+)/methenyltetrahydrofolate cyclohydrolase